jgi:hypothetical protein
MRWGRLAPVATAVACALAGTAAAAWQSGVYTGTLRNPGYGNRGTTPIRLSVSRTQVRVLGAYLSFRCPSAKKRVTVKIGPLKPARIRVRTDTGGAQFSLSETLGSTHVTVAGGIAPGKPLQGLLDASRDTPAGVCEDSALFTAKPR